MRIMTTRGLVSRTWEMHLRRLKSILVRWLGSQEPEEGVVLGLHPDYDFI
jgi:hypothetical protein